MLIGYTFIMKGQVIFGRTWSSDYWYQSSKSFSCKKAFRRFGSGRNVVAKLMFLELDKWRLKAKRHRSLRGLTTDAACCKSHSQKSGWLRSLMGNLPCEIQPSNVRSAPAKMRNLTTEVQPSDAARYRGVSPLPFTQFTSIPAFTNVLIISISEQRSPPIIAGRAGLVARKWRRYTSTAVDSSVGKMSFLSLATAKCKALSPLCVKRFTSMPRLTRVLTISAWLQMTLWKRGDQPFTSWALITAPLCTNSFATATWSRSDARCSGVRPTSSQTFTSVPSIIMCFTVGRWPFHAAQCKGLIYNTSVASICILESLVSRIQMMSVNPRAAAWWSGYFLALVVSGFRTSAPPFTRTLTMSACFRVTAKHSGFVLKWNLQFKSAPPSTNCFTRSMLFWLIASFK